MRLVITNNNLSDEIIITKTISQNTKRGEVEIKDARISLRCTERADYGDVYEVTVDGHNDPTTDRSIEGIAIDLGISRDNVYLMPIGEYFTEFDHKRQLEEIERAKRSFPNAKDYVALLFDATCDRIPGVAPDVRGRAYEVIVECVQKYIAAEVHRRYPTYGKEWEDMIQSAIVAFCDSIGRYKPEKGQPTTFLAPIITHACYEYLAHSKGTTPHYLQIESDISRIKRRIAAFEGDAAVNPVRVYEMCEGKYSAEQIMANWELVDRSSDVSIDNEEAGLSEIPDQAPNPEEVYLKAERRQVISELFRAALTPRELKILAFNKSDDHKAKQTSARFGVSPSELKSISTKAMKRLRAEASTGKYGDDIRNLVEHLWKRHRRQLGYSDAKLASDSELMLAQTEESRRFFEDICSDLDDANDSSDYSFANPEDIGVQIPSFTDEDHTDDDPDDGASACVVK